MDKDFAPYGPGTAVTDTIKRYRDRGLPVPVTPQALEAIGVAPTMAPRTLQSLQFLGLLDEENNPTELFQRLKRASTDEYRGQLAEVVRAAYIRVFEIVAPATDGDIAIADAFRAFEPSKQRVKMISLFRALCVEAGIMEKSRSRTTTRRPRADGTKSKQRARGNDGTPPPPAPSNGDGGTSRTDAALSQDEMRSELFKLLLKGAAEGIQFDPEVLNRMERIAGVEPGEEKDRGWTTAGSKPATPASPASQGEG